MAGREYSSYQQGIINRYYEHKDTIALQRLGEIVSDMYLAQGRARDKLWDKARGSLMKIAPSDPRTIEVLRERNVEKLAALVGELNAQAGSQPAGGGGAESGGSANPQASDVPAIENVAAPVERGGSSPSPENLKSAMKAFRKRLKLTRLDDESRLARSPMSSGKASQIRAILPPREFGTEVWEELVNQGKLKRAGGGFYELIE